MSSDNQKFLVFYEDNPNDFENTSEGISSESCSLDENTSNKPKRAKLGYEAFSKKLRVYTFETLNELKISLYERISEYKNEYGVLCFLYSLLLTKVNLQLYIR